MIDNEIIKALECCKNGLCTDYPRLNTPAHILLCKEQLMCETLDLINRQNDLIHRQSDVISEQKEKIERMYVEAVKEFAEKLKEIITMSPKNSILIDKWYIDNLVKEMVGEG